MRNLRGDPGLITVVPRGGVPNSLAATEAGVDPRLAPVASLQPIGFVESLEIGSTSHDILGLFSGESDLAATTTC